MARKVIPIKVEAIQGSSGPIVQKEAISHVAIDFGREDLNNLGKKINEIIDHLNS